MAADGAASAAAVIERQRFGRRRLVTRRLAAQRADQSQVIVRRSADVDVSFGVERRRRRSSTGQTAFEGRVDVLVANAFTVRPRLRQRDHFRLHQRVDHQRPIGS